MNEEGFWKMSWRAYKTCIICIVISLVMGIIYNMLPVKIEILGHVGASFLGIAILFAFIGLSTSLKEEKLEDKEA